MQALSRGYRSPLQTFLAPLLAPLHHASPLWEAPPRLYTQASTRSSSLV